MRDGSGVGWCLLKLSVNEQWRTGSGQVHPVICPISCAYTSLGPGAAAEAELPSRPFLQSSPSYAIPGGRVQRESLLSSLGSHPDRTWPKYPILKVSERKSWQMSKTPELHSEWLSFEGEPFNTLQMWLISVLKPLTLFHQSKLITKSKDVKNKSVKNKARKIFASLLI